jgi:hypothetical protein
VGPSAKNGVPSVGRRHRLLCADGQAWRSAKAGQLGFQRGQQRAGLWRGFTLCRRHPWSGRRHSVRQLNVTAVRSSPTGCSVPRANPRQRIRFAEGRAVPTVRPSAKMVVPWVNLCRRRRSAQINSAEGPTKCPRQSRVRSAKPEFPVVTIHSIRSSHILTTFSKLNTFNQNFHCSPSFHSSHPLSVHANQCAILSLHLRSTTFPN